MCGATVPQQSLLPCSSTERTAWSKAAAHLSAASAKAPGRMPASVRASSAARTPRRAPGREAAGPQPSPHHNADAKAHDDSILDVKIGNKMPTKWKRNGASPINVSCKIGMVPAYSPHVTQRQRRPPLSGPIQEHLPGVFSALAAPACEGFAAFSVVVGS